MMSVADYVLAVLGALVCLVWCGGSFLIAAIDAFAPCPNEATAKTGRKGCASLIVALLALVYFGGVLLNGTWSWLG